MRKRLCCLFMCMMLLCLFGILKQAYAEDIEGNFQYTTSGVEKEPTEKTMTYSYRDSFFTCSSYDLNLDLAAMSIRMAFAGFGVGEESLPSHLLPLFDALSVQYDDSTIHYGKASADSIGYAYGVRHISEDELVVCLVIRGGNYGDEWASNFTMGTGSTHQGFQQAAAMVSTELRSYLQTLPANRKISVWITGYSRGAAVANLVAYGLDGFAASGELGVIKPENIYAFCFECPLTSKVAMPTEDNTLYNNIFSFVNDLDPVTKVAPGRWGFQRYGVTYYLPSAMNCADYAERMQKMLPLYGEYADASVYAIDYAQTIYLDRFFEKIIGIIGSQSIYEKYLQDTIRKTILGEKTVSNKIADAVMPYIQRYLEKEKDEPSSNNIVNFGVAHAPELCIAWIDVLREENKLFVAEREYEFLTIDGKTDVYVYDADMKLIASGNGEKVSFIDIERTIGIAYGMGDEFLLAYPKGGTYYVVISAQKRDRISITKSLYDMCVSRDIDRTEYDKILFKKDEGAFLILAPNATELYRCNQDDLPLMQAEFEREGKVTGTIVQPSSSKQTDEIVYPKLKKAVEITPTPIITEAPEVTETPEPSKAEGNNGKGTPFSEGKLWIFAGAALILTTVILLISLCRKKRNKPSSSEV